MKTITELEEEIERIRNTLDDVDFQKSTLSQMTELNKYIEILTLERLIEEKKEIAEIIEEKPKIEKLENSNPYSTYMMNDFFNDVCESMSKTTGRTKQEICDDFWSFLTEYRDKIVEELLKKINGKEDGK